MSRQWTDNQLKAIDALDGSILVSAAAGSGKTAVLTQRVINRLTDSKNPVSADRLLIVTFTRAAAKEMRDRISQELTRLLREDPNNKMLADQQMLLPSAKICTIDSFCYDLVKENFQYLFISPDFKIGDEGELALLSREAMDITMEELYKADDNGNFKNLSELVFVGRDDTRLTEMIEKLHTSAMSFPFPDKWLEELGKSFVPGENVKDSVYGKIVLSHIRDSLVYCISMIKQMTDACDENPIADKAYRQALSEDLAQTEYILDRILTGESWDEIRRSALSYKAAARKRLTGDEKDDEGVISIEAKRKKLKEEIKDIGVCMCCSQQEYEADMEFLRPMVKELIRAAQLYSKNFALLKKEKKLADFSDVTNMAISLLVESDGDSWKSTAFAENMKKSFDEILIDEYQDTNAAQDMLFTAISDNNLFRVGDVKQSIYRFRQANPDIFIFLKNTYETYDKQKNNYPAKIILGNNFRSRRSVTDTINFIFSQIMSPQCGDVSYDDEEKLIFSAEYYNKSENDFAELHLVGAEKADTYYGNVTNLVQARHIASHIKKMLAEGFTVKDGDGERPATYKDFAVLLRSTGSGKGLEYAEVFRSEGVPCFTEVPGKFLTSVEISLVLNILRIIDNPKQDIALMSVMMSPVFGFSPDEMAELRLQSRHKDLYSCLLLSQENPRVSAFIEQVRAWREVGLCLSVKDLISEIYDTTALLSIFDAIDPSLTKRANLNLLCDYASIYEELGYNGLSGFISFVDRLSSKQRDISGSVGVVSQSNSVKIMTIHKSKGLEFPVCFVAGISTKFNRTDETDSLIVTQKYGIGALRRDLDTFEQYPTLSHKAMKLAVRKDNTSEELRVLYVALTRAKEKLIMVYCGDKIDDDCKRYASRLTFKGKSYPPFAVSHASCYGEWIISALLRHPAADILREYAGLGNEVILRDDAPVRVFSFNYCVDENEQRPSEASGKVNKELLSLIEERAAFRYKYEALADIIMKRAASETDKNFIDRDYFASSSPAFLSAKGLTGAAKGVATHTFVQFADYERARQSVTDEIARLEGKGILTSAQAQAIDVPSAETFFSGKLIERILASDKVLREKKFTIEVPVKDIYEGFDDFPEEKMMIQGIADCAFLEDGELVVVDYKTDNLSREEDFIEKYSSQVLLYRKALEITTGYKVKETLLYSFRLGKEIRVMAEDKK